jgi:nitrogen fixation protein NifQ
MNAQAETEHTDQMEMYNTLMARSQKHENDHVLASILASWQSGEGALTDWLGLDEKTFNEMLVYHFPGISSAIFNTSGEQLDVERFDERDELHQLLSVHCAGKSPSEHWMLEILINACQGMDHLWQDLGLWSRKDLSQLIQNNFPTLAVLNDKDMKWKKFLYKQLCIAEGIYTCRAPSCQVCADYADCFGPEE